MSQAKFIVQKENENSFTLICNIPIHQMMESFTLKNNLDSIINVYFYYKIDQIILEFISLNGESIKPFSLNGVYLLFNGNELLFEENDFDIQSIGNDLSIEDKEKSLNLSNLSNRCHYSISLIKLLNYIQENNIFDLDLQGYLRLHIKIQFINENNKEINQKDNEINDNIENQSIEESFELIEENIESLEENIEDFSSIDGNSSILDVGDENKVYDSEETDEDFELSESGNLSEYMNNDESINVISSEHNESYYIQQTNAYVGLENQGATCYLNSLLQSLFHLRILNRIISDIPLKKSLNTETTSSKLTIEESLIQNNSILALQSLFYEMTKEDKSSKGYIATTNNLTKSFGWDEEDVFEQHDVQELFSILLDKLENELKASSLPNSISMLFEGKEIHYVKCFNVPSESKLEQTVRDIQLPIEGCSTLYEGFDKYTEAENLVGQNQYRTEKYGLQDAKKGIIFKSFPPILVIHLKRFKFDETIFNYVKINDKFEFYDRINLSKYLVNSNNSDADYVLFSVMVQSGSMEMGHYYNFVRPFSELLENDLTNQKSEMDLINQAKWYKFDDEYVYEVDSRYAIESNYGAKNSHSSAYMLIYIRTSQIREIITPFKRVDFPLHVRQIVSKLQDTREMKRVKLEQTKNRAYFEIYTDNYILMRSRLTLLNGIIPYKPNQNGNGSYNGVKLSESEVAEYSPKVVTISKNSTFSELIKSIQQKMEIDTTIPLRIWVFEERKNGTLRPLRFLTPSSLESKLYEIPIFSYSKHSSKVLNHKLFVQFLEKENADSMKIHLSASNQSEYNDKILLFLKTFTYQGLRYAKSVTVSPSLKLIEFIQNSKYESIVEELKPNNLKIKDLNSTVSESGLIDGDIIVLIEKGIPISSVNDYFYNVAYNVRIRLVPHGEKGNEYIVYERTDLLYESFCKKISEVINWPSDCIRFYGYNEDDECYLTIPFKSNTNYVKELLQYQTGNFHLEYELLNESASIREQKKEIKVYFFDGRKIIQVLDICCYLDTKLLDAIINLGYDLPPKESSNMQFVSVYQNKIRKIYPITVTLNQIENENSLYNDFPKSYIRIEYIPSKPKEILINDCYIIEIVYFYDFMGKINYDDIPFLMAIDIKWTAKMLRSKILENLSSKAAERQKNARIALFKSNGSRIYVKDKDILQEKLNDISYIGLEKISTQPKQLKIS